MTILIQMRFLPGGACRCRSSCSCAGKPSGLPTLRPARAVLQSTEIARQFEFVPLWGLAVVYRMRRSAPAGAASRWRR